MVLGVPVFALFYTLLSQAVNRKLNRKGKTTETTRYDGIKTVADLDPLPEPEEPEDFEAADTVVDLDDEIEIEDEAETDWPSNMREEDYDFAGLD